MRDPFVIDGLTALSLSGGRTSAYMLHRVLKSNMGMPNSLEICFGNTGKEDEKTLEFLRDIERHWKVPIVWLEYRDNEQGYEIVNFETAIRNGEPFEAIIKKRQYLPNPVTRFCTVELKIRTMHKYLKSLNWHKSEDGWSQMVGIRADEQRRVAKIRARPSPETVKETMIMPLEDAGVTKHDVGNFWKNQPFDLGLKSINGETPEGNCDLCFLKAANKVFTLIKEKPDKAIWWAKMEALALALASKPSGAVFRSDRPNYRQMYNYSQDQSDMFAAKLDPSEEAIACFCGD